MVTGNGHMFSGRCQIFSECVGWSQEGIRCSLESVEWSLEGVRWSWKGVGWQWHGFIFTEMFSEKAKPLRIYPSFRFGGLLYLNLTFKFLGSYNPHPLPIEINMFGKVSALYII